MEVLKVSTKSNPNSVAGALAAVIKEKNVVEIQAVGAGAINQANKITYWDNEIITYEGLNLVNIHIYPHLDINNIDNLKEILLVSKYQRIYALPDNSFIRIQNDNIEIYGDYYVLG